MSNDDQQVLVQSAQKFQQSIADSWKNAFESFQNMDLGEMAGKMMTPPAQPPKITFDPAKLQALQQEYLTEAAEIWTEGAQGKLVIKDRRHRAGTPE